MGIRTEHPDYQRVKNDWVFMEDSFEGQTAIKNKTITYLPATGGQTADGMGVDEPGYCDYQRYLSRALYPDYVEVGIETLVGILNSKPPHIVVPKGMERIVESGTANKEPLTHFLKQIHTEQLKNGRVGLFMDMPLNPNPADPELYFVMYAAKAPINWNTDNDNSGEEILTTVVLDECGQKMDQETLDWTDLQQWRLLRLTSAGYSFGVTNTQDGLPELKPFIIRGTRLNSIPFVFVNSKDLLATPDKPPLLGLANTCMAIYRAEADYRFTLFMQGQETLVVVNSGTSGSKIGEEEGTRVGAGAKIEVMLGGDAKYIGVSAASLAEQRMGLENDKAAAAVRTGQLLTPGKMSLESGEALKTRVAAQTATLTDIAKTSCLAVERLLKLAAKALGLNEDEVKVTPNLDFVVGPIAGQDIVQLQTAKSLGFPVSAETLHDIARDRGLTRKTFEEEIALMNKEPPVIKKIMEANQKSSLTGNNPTQTAGGPKKSTTGKKPVSNKPKA